MIINSYRFLKNLLLDLYPATTAYSLSKLSVDYTGAAVNVRRGSDNATVDIGFLRRDLDIAALEAFCTGTDGFVTTWYDQSGNGYDAVQALASAQPQIVSNGSVLLENGKPAIISDGVDDYLDSGIISFTNPVTMFMVSRKISGAYTVVGLKNGIFMAGAFYSQPTGYLFGQNGPQYSPVVGDNNQNLLYAKTSTIGTDWEAGTNGVLVTNSGEDIGTVTPNQITTSFAPYRINLAVQSFIVYNSDQSANRIAIEENINSYYNIFPAEQTILSYYIQRVEADGGQVEAQPYVLQTITDLN